MKCTDIRVLALTATAAALGAGACSPYPAGGTNRGKTGSDNATLLAIQNQGIFPTVEACASTNSSYQPDSIDPVTFSGDIGYAEDMAYILAVMDDAAGNDAIEWSVGPPKEGNIVDPDGYLTCGGLKSVIASYNVGAGKNTITAPDCTNEDDSTGEEGLATLKDLVDTNLGELFLGELTNGRGAAMDTTIVDPSNLEPVLTRMKGNILGDSFAASDDGFDQLAAMFVLRTWPQVKGPANQTSQTAVNFESWGSPIQVWHVMVPLFALSFQQPCAIHGSDVDVSDKHDVWLSIAQP